MAELDKEMALRMNAATIHEVKTVAGGIIITKAYLDESALGAMSRWLAKSESFLHSLDDEGKTMALENWLSTAELASSEDVVEGWRLAGEVLLSTLIVLPAGRKRLCTFLKKVHRSGRDRWAAEVMKKLKAT